MILKIIVARLIWGLLFQGIECNGGVTEEEELQTTHGQERAADQEVPREMVLPESASGEFDFNEFFNLDKSVPGLASVSTKTAPPAVGNIWKPDVLSLMKEANLACSFCCIEDLGKTGQ